MASNSTPKWVTPERQTCLARIVLEYLRQRNGWQVQVGEDFFTSTTPEAMVEFVNPTLKDKLDGMVADWAQDDREQDRYEWLDTQKRIHSLGEKVLPLRGRFSAVGREVYHDAQPLYYLIGIGISGVTNRPFAKVRLASSYLNLHIDLGDILKGVRRNKRKKILRYGGNFPIERERQVASLVNQAILHHRAQ